VGTPVAETVAATLAWSSVGTHVDYAGNFTFFVNANGEEEIRFDLEF